MRNYWRPMFMLLIFQIGSTISTAQKVLTTAGGTINGENCTIDWTLGEVICFTMEEGNMAVTQGFQQPVCAPMIMINDACVCIDPKNILDPQTGEVLLYHAQITISSTVPVTDQFEIVAILEGEVFDENGENILGTASALSFTLGENQVIDIWHKPNANLKLLIENLAWGERFEFSIELECDCPPIIPTMGSWALFLLGLVMSTMAVLKLYQLRKAPTINL